jgi:hypothetical protein
MDNDVLKNKIARAEELNPGEMVDLMKYCRNQMAQGVTIEKVYDELGIDPSKSLIVA